MTLDRRVAIITGANRFLAGGDKAAALREVFDRGENIYASLPESLSMMAPNA